MICPHCHKSLPTLADLLAERHRRELSQVAMATACGVRAQHWNAWERGRRVPDAETIAKCWEKLRKARQ